MMSQVSTNGEFITFPVISVTQPEQGERILDRFDINVIAKHIVAVNGLDGASRHATNGGKSTVHFATESGMRAIISEAKAEDIIGWLEIDDFVCFNVLSASEHEVTGERLIERFTGYAKPDIIVGINALDGKYKQVSDDVQAIVYFKPASGLRPTLSTDPASEIIDAVNSKL